MRRRFGRIRQLPSGRWQARYRGPDGIVRSGPTTFERKADADRWLSQVELEVLAGDWIDPDGGHAFLGEYATAWVRHRVGLRPKTRLLYEGLVRNHIAPALGQLPLGKVSPAKIREWRGELDHRVSPTTGAKAYRLLHTIMETAVDDRLVRRNPCRIKGAAVERPAERPVLTVEQVFTLADAIESRYRALVLLGTFASMRFGELAALQRQYLDVDSGFVDFTSTLVEMGGSGQLLVGPPKTAAGRRRVAIPAGIVPDLRRHLDEFVDGDPDALVFAGPKGAPLRRSNFQAKWVPALLAANLPAIHFHDLRHTGNTLAAQAGATMPDLMARMGHASTRAAQIYLHTNSARDRIVAEALDEMISATSSRR